MARHAVMIDTAVFLAAWPTTLLTVSPITDNVPAMRKRLNPQQSRDELLAAAGRLALRVGFHSVTIAGTATEAERAPGLVWHYFRSLATLRSDLMQAAIKHKCAAIVADGLALGEVEASDLPRALLGEARAVLAAR